MLADSHVHFFSPGFAESLPETCRRTAPDELTLYEAFRDKYDIKAVLAVGYEDNAAYQGNNDYLASISGSRDWLYPLAFVNPSALSVAFLEQRHAQKFAGLSMYLMSPEQVTAMASVDDAVWDWLIVHQALVSVNTRGGAWKAWPAILKRHPKLRLLISHMGLPGKWASVPNKQQASEALASVLALAAYPEVQVKLSAFYAISDPYHDFPHPQARPVMDQLLNTFGAHRLLWGSDFAPVLEYVSFPQTIEPLDRWESLSPPQRQAIKAGNLLSLLDDVRMGR